ncbi:MAG: FG-GAP repeat domain-containing protein [Desulfovibrio sp.]
MPLKRLSALILLCLALAVPALTLAQGARTFAVLPFKVNSDKFQYLSKGAQSPTSNRLTWLGHFEPVDADRIARAAGRFPSSASDAQSIMGSIGSDFLVAGKLDFQDNDKQIDITLNVYDRAGKSWSKNSRVPLEGLLPALERLSNDVRAEVFKRPGEGAKAEERKEAPAASAAKTSVPRNANFVAGDSGDAPVGPAGGPVMNPQFRYEGGAQTPGRWQSQSLRFASANMVVGDFVGDKKNRVIVASPTTLHAYEFSQNTLKPLGEHLLGARVTLLRVSLYDFDRDGRNEIIASGVDDRDGNALPRTFIMSYSNGKFENFMPPQKMYLSVVRTPPTYRPTLLGQIKGHHSPFDEAGVSEMIYQDGTLQHVRKLRLPSMANLFNVAFLPDGNSFKIVALNEYNYMKVFTSDLELQYSQEDGYNSSNNYLYIDERLPGMDQGVRELDTAEQYYVPIRMLPVSFDSSGKYELLVNKDISLAAQIFKKFRRFSQGEIHSLFWDGVGMSLAWKTRRIKGTVVDIALEDIKNDGTKQLVVCINTYSGAVGASNEKTIVVAYDLNAEK